MQPDGGKDTGHPKCGTGMGRGGKEKETADGP